jgi:proteasome alpha subunit
VMGGQADKVAAILKDQYAPGMSLTAAMTLAIAALSGQGDGANAEPVTSGQLEVALLERSRTHRAFRRLTGARLEALLAESASADEGKAGSATAESGASESGAAESGTGEPDAGATGSDGNGSASDGAAGSGDAPGS